MPHSTPPVCSCWASHFCQKTPCRYWQKWNMTCKPPWNERELNHKLADAAKQPGERGYLLHDEGRAVTHQSWQEVEKVESPSAVAAAPAADPWPELDSRALYGLAGEFVNTILPHTEASAAALLVQFLAAAGNCIGRAPYWRSGGDRHYPNLFAAIVGKSAKSRKGSSLSENKRLFDHVNNTWTHNCIKSGCSSSEGILWNVRDADEDQKDKGVTDKRLLIVEPEFAKLLKQSERAGNTLSALLRDAWDSGYLETLTKNQPMRAHGAHISIIGHITNAELLRTLTATDIHGGLGNRFLWVAAKRSKLLPLGGNLPDSALNDLCMRLQYALLSARKMGELRRNSAADRYWCQVYPRLTAEGEGLSFSLTSRAEPQTMRLALIYALLDGAQEINQKHIEAALAVWSYCEQSVYATFGNALGDETADEILQALQQAAPSGLPRNAINEHFHGHKLSTEIGRALALLLRLKRVRTTTSNTTGRPQELWFATAEAFAAYPAYPSYF